MDVRGCTLVGSSKKRWFGAEFDTESGTILQVDVETVDDGILIRTQFEELHDFLDIHQLCRARNYMIFPLKPRESLQPRQEIFVPKKSLTSTLIRRRQRVPSRNSIPSYFLSADTSPVIAPTVCLCERRASIVVFPVAEARPSNVLKS